VTYQMIRGTASYYMASAGLPDEPWLVEKVLKAGESYLIGTFLDRQDAVRCLDSLRASLEVARGATVTEAA